MATHLTMAPVDLHPELEAAAYRYAAMSPSDFVDEHLSISVTKLRALGMVSSETWARVPAGVAVRVIRAPEGALQASVMLPWQAKDGDPGLGCARSIQNSLLDGAKKWVVLDAVAILLVLWWLIWTFGG